MKKLNVSESKENEKLFTTSIDALKNLYSTKIKPLETLTKFGDFYTPTLTDSDIEAKPMVLLIGQYSTGKTTFVQYLCERDVPGANIGPEPTTDKFCAFMTSNGMGDQIIPGNTVCVQEDKPFKGLARFGTGFMNKFQCSMCEAPILQSVTFIDTPGVLSGTKQSQRSYDFPSVASWFAERSDMILLLFDAHKLDISDEFKQAIESLKGHDEKIKIVLNKADKVSSQQLLRVYGALLWSLSKVIQTPEVMRVYLGSFWNGGPLQNPETENLLHSEMVDLIKELLLLPKNAAVRKVNDLVKRARMTKVHAYILSHLRNEMPIFGKEKKQAELIVNLDKEFEKISRLHHLPAGDFPDLEKYRAQLKVQDFTKFPKLNEKLMNQIDEVLSSDFPKLLQRFPLDGSHQKSNYELNPFALDEVDESQRWQFYENVDQNSFYQLFNSLNPVNGKVSGAECKLPLSQSGLPSNILAHIWRLCDINKEGKLDFELFCLAMHLVNVKLKGYELPDQLPATLIPFGKRNDSTLKKFNAENILKGKSIKRNSSKSSSLKKSLDFSSPKSKSDLKNFQK